MGLYLLISYGQDVYWYTYEAGEIVQKIDLLPYIGVTLRTQVGRVDVDFGSDRKMKVRLEGEVVDEKKHMVTYKMWGRNQQTKKNEMIEVETSLSKFLLDYVWDYGGAEFEVTFGEKAEGHEMRLKVGEGMIEPLVGEVLAEGEEMVLQLAYGAAEVRAGVGVYELESGEAWTWGQFLEGDF
ncbi:MAG TPA: hypothetical protein VLL52_08995 [Anaerolineae bacterium]|nr:hypothetical protein [Anaerolineae bacterium]